MDVIDEYGKPTINKIKLSVFFSCKYNLLPYNKIIRPLVVCLFPSLAAFFRNLQRPWGFFYACFLMDGTVSYALSFLINGGVFLKNQSGVRKKHKDRRC